MKSQRVTFTNADGHELSARLELPADQSPGAFAVFAHCFTCNKNLSAVRNISRALNQSGIAVLRFDFTGLGESEGEFADTNFSSNVSDLLCAADWLKNNHESPKLIVGHSLGGAAVLHAAHHIDSIQAVATVGSPMAPQHVSHLLADGLEAIQTKGEGEVNIGGRSFTIKKQFIEDLSKQSPEDVIKTLRKPLLILHSPQDTIVGIDQAAEIYTNAHHPKSFVSLDGADHLLSRKEDSEYVGNVIAHWVVRYMDIKEPEVIETEHQVVARLDNEPGYTTEIRSGKHSIIADEPKRLGGNDLGPGPYDLLASALASCTAITVKMYAKRKEWPLEEVRVHVTHDKRETPDSGAKKVDHFKKKIEFVGDLDEKQLKRLSEIADKCPVNRTLNSEVIMEKEVTRLH